jgi:hypothetical protein
MPRFTPDIIFNLLRYPPVREGGNKKHPTEIVQFEKKFKEEVLKNERDLNPRFWDSVFFHPGNHMILYVLLSVYRDGRILNTIASVFTGDTVYTPAVSADNCLYTHETFNQENALVYRTVPSSSGRRVPGYKLCSIEGFLNLLEHPKTQGQNHLDCPVTKLRITHTALVSQLSPSECAKLMSIDSKKLEVSGALNAGALTLNFPINSELEAREVCLKFFKSYLPLVSVLGGERDINTRLNLFCSKAGCAILIQLYKKGDVEKAKVLSLLAQNFECMLGGAINLLKMLLRLTINMPTSMI